LLINRSDKRGFTLVEVMIVIAVMAIMSAIAFPNFRTFLGQRRLNGATRQVQSDLLATRMKAVSETKDIRILFLDSYSYTIFYDYNNNGAVDSGEAIQTKDIRPAYYDVTITPVSSYAPLFYARGTSNNGSITFTGSTGTKTITIDTVGRVRIN